MRSEPVDVVEVVDHHRVRRRASTASSSSSSLLALPCRTSLPGSAPALTAVRISPPPGDVEDAGPLRPSPAERPCTGTTSMRTPRRSAAKRLRNAREVVAGALPEGILGRRRWRGVPNWSATSSTRQPRSSGCRRCRSRFLGEEAEATPSWSAAVGCGSSSAQRATAFASAVTRNSPLHLSVMIR